MTRVKAATVASALVTAGFSFEIEQRPPNSDNWVITSHADSASVPVGVVNTFVNNQGITGLLQAVEYS